jgi:signal transduction histidine kinase
MSMSIQKSVNDTKQSVKARVLTKRKNEKLDAIKETAQKLSASREIERAMMVIVRSIKKLFPDVVIAYTSAPIGDEKSPKVIYVHSQQTIGRTYLEAIKKRMIEKLKNMTYVGMNKIVFKSWMKDSFHLELSGVQYNEDDRLELLYSINIPIKVSRVCAVLTNFSFARKNMLNDNNLNVIHTIVENAEHRIERLKELVSSEQSRVSDLVGSMTNGVLMFDNAGTIVVTNPAAQQFLNIGNKEKKITDIFKKIKEEIVPSAEAGKKKEIDLQTQVYNALADGKPKHIDELLLGQKTLEMFIAPVRDYEKNVSGGALILHDITHLKEIDRMKTEFVSIASHQLRTPLTAIKLFIEMLADEKVGSLTKKQKEYVGDVTASTERMIKLVNDLLNVSRLETGRLKIEPVPTDIIAFVKEIVEDAMPLCQPKGCTITFEPPTEKIAKVPIDAELLRQVVHNLITNAIRYSQDRGKIVISLQQLTTDNLPVTAKGVQMSNVKDHWLISVADQGIGIPKEAKAKIFEKFYRADNARKAETEGSGLGMYLAKMIMETSGGKIWFDSEEGKGTTFYVTIPKNGMEAKKGERGVAA